MMEIELQRIKYNSPISLFDRTQSVIAQLIQDYDDSKGEERKRNSRQFVIALQNKFDRVAKECNVEIATLIDATDEDGRTALMVAVEDGQVDVVQALIDGGADITVKTKEHEITALIYAMMRGDDEIIKILLTAGARMETLTGKAMICLVERERENIIEYYYNVGEFEWSRYGRDLLGDIIPAAQERRLSLGEKNLKYLETPNVTLLYAVEKGYADVVRACLQKGDNPNASSSKNNTALMIAAANGNVAILKILIAAGADINEIKTRPYRSALLSAVERGHLEAVSLLIKYGAYVITVRVSGLTGGRISYVDVLWKAVIKRNVEIVKVLLSDVARLDPELGDGCMRINAVLSDAIHKDYADIVEVFLAAKRSAEIALRYDCLKLAVVNGSANVVQTLLNTGHDINATFNYGGTLLHLAVETGRANVVQVLLKNGAAINAKTFIHRNTPLLLAIKKGHTEIIKTFLASGLFEEGHDAVQKIPRALVDIEKILQIQSKIIENITLLNDDKDSPKKLLALERACYELDEDNLDAAERVLNGVTIDEEKKQEEKIAGRQLPTASMLDLVMGFNGFYGKILNHLSLKDFVGLDSVSEKRMSKLLAALNPANKPRSFIGFDIYVQAANPIMQELVDSMRSIIERSHVFAIPEIIPNLSVVGKVSAILAAYKSKGEAVVMNPSLVDMLSIGPISTVLSEYINSPQVDHELSKTVPKHQQNINMKRAANLVTMEANANKIEEYTGVPRGSQAYYRDGVYKGCYVLFHASRDRCLEEQSKEDSSFIGGAAGEQRHDDQKIADSVPYWVARSQFNDKGKASHSPDM
jgi:ankyrin repeat protein